MEYDKNNNTSFWREYMRIRVKFDVRKPLKQQTRVKNKGGEWCTVKFKYEKFSLFYFVCGMLGHSQQRCVVQFARVEDDRVRGWSNDIKANQLRYGGEPSSRWLKNETSSNMESEKETEVLGVSSMTLMIF